MYLLTPSPAAAFACAAPGDKELLWSCPVMVGWTGIHSTEALGLWWDKQVYDTGPPAPPSCEGAWLPLHRRDWMGKAALGFLLY